VLICAWCHAPAVGEVVVEPARFGGQRGRRVLVAAERRSPACKGCRDRLSGPGLNFKSVRRRGVIEGQTSIDEQLEGTA
jgi:hypothetical protein